MSLALVTPCDFHDFQMEEQQCNGTSLSGGWYTPECVNAGPGHHGDLLHFERGPLRGGLVATLGALRNAIQAHNALNADLSDGLLYAGLGGVFASLDLADDLDMRTLCEIAGP